MRHEYRCPETAGRKNAAAHTAPGIAPRDAARYLCGMKTTSFEVRSHRRDEMINVTQEVAAAVSRCGVSEGLVTVFVPHTTAGVTINENADPDVVHDMLLALDRAVPWSQDFYKHNEGNSAAHVKSSMVGCFTTIPILAGKMVLGTWQGVYFCEFDGPRTRKCHVAVNGD